MFQYVNMLKKEKPQEWVFKECQDLSAMGFRFIDKQNPRNYTCYTSAKLHVRVNREKTRTIYTYLILCLVIIIHKLLSAYKTELSIG